MRAVRRRAQDREVLQIASISGIAGDLLAVVLGLLIFAVLLAVLEGIDRI
jgi:hypothetical protein